MRLTNTYTRIALRNRESNAEWLEEEDDDDRVEAMKGEAVNPWAVCHSQLGPEKDEKFERCVQDVKKTHKIKKD
jgi:hypothetical protein